MADETLRIGFFNHPSRAVRHPAFHFFDSISRGPSAGCGFSNLEVAANQAATGNNPRAEPTARQIEAGNYKLGRVKVEGLPGIRIENVRNSLRSGVDADGQAWTSRMAAHYGYFAGTRGVDGDGVDVFVGPLPELKSAWVINQRNAAGGFDEHKCMVGFANERQARDAYTHSYTPGWQGLMSIVPVSIDQLAWWLGNGDMARPLSADQLIFERDPIMDKVLWSGDAVPTSMPMHQLMYAMRQEDGADGLLLDAVSMNELMTDPDLDAMPVLDALVLEVGRMKQKMGQILAVLKSAAEAVQPADFMISDPVKSRGVLQIAVLFPMSDGQTVTIWFHNPDTTPNNLTPMDELVSWKWMLNKKDVTIWVAPERGRDLNIREVSRRIMRLVEKNSATFLKANAKAAELAANDKALDEQIAGLDAELGTLTRQIEVAKIAKEDGEIAAVKRKRGDGIDPTTAQGYAEVMADSNLQRVFEDPLDSLFSERIVSVRNALRGLGWEIPTSTFLGHKTIDGGTHSVQHEPIKAPSGGNIMGVIWSVDDGTTAFNDDLVLTTGDLARVIDAAIQPVAIEAALPGEVEEPQPTDSPGLPETVAAPDVLVEPVVLIEPLPQTQQEALAELEVAVDPGAADVVQQAVVVEAPKIVVDPEQIEPVVPADPVSEAAEAPAEASATEEVAVATLADVPATILVDLDGTEVLSMMRVQDDDGNAIPADKQVFDAAREYFRAHVQGRTIANVHIGDVTVNGSITWGKIKRGLTYNVLRVKLLAAIPALLKKGFHVGTAAIDKERDDGAQAFHHLVGWVDVAGVSVEVGVSVMQLERGKFMYNLADSPSELLTKKQSRIVKSGESPTDSALDSATSAAGDDANVALAVGDVNQAGDVLDDASGMVLTGIGLNFYILKVRGADGQDMPEEVPADEPVEATLSPVESLSTVARVDAAYTFLHATERFKAYIGDTVGEADASMFQTAKEVDLAVYAKGGVVTWDLDYAEHLDSADGADEPVDLGAPVLDGAAVLITVVGRVLRESLLVGRVIVDGAGIAVGLRGETTEVQILAPTPTALVDQLFGSPVAPEVSVAVVEEPSGATNDEPVESPPVADITYRKSDDMFTAFYPDTEAGQEAWKLIAADSEGSGKVLNIHADAVIAQLRAAGYKVKKEKADKVDADELLRELMADEPTASAPASLNEVGRNDDIQYLHALIAGEVDMLDAGVFDRLEPMFAKYEQDDEMMVLLNSAATAFSDATTKAAQAALA